MKRLSLVLLASLVASACAETGPRTPPVAAPEPPSQSLRVRPDPIVFGDTLVGCTSSVQVATGVEPPTRPLDLVFVLDVSTSMDEIAMARRAIEKLFDEIEHEVLDVRVGLTTFENDVVVHQRGAFLHRTTFFRELDTQLVNGTWIPDSSLPRQLLNFELEENLLDALYDSATEFDFRPEARRFLFLVTDDTFLKPPAVFSDGNPVRRSYADVVTALTDRQISVFSVHSSEKGEGLSSSYEDQASLVVQTGGDWFELSEVQAESLERTLSELLTRPDCR
jgi:hypothetical protein